MASIVCSHVSKRFAVAQEPKVAVFDRQRTAAMSAGGGSRSDDAPVDGPVAALNDVSLEVKDGESMVIVGSSGCGKSTLLRCIAGLESYEGDIFYGEQNMREVPPRERGIGIVFQNYALYPQFESKGNLAFFFKLRKREGEIDDRVRQTSEIMGLGFDVLLDRKPNTLSGGQKQRVAIARAICRDPKLLLFDEPLSNLDAQLRSSTRIEIRRLINRFGITTLYVTHDQTEATIMGDRLCVMDKGRVMQIGTYRELYDRPLNAFVAGFLGAPAMNLFEGVVADNAVAVDGAALPLPSRARPYVTAGQRVVVGFRPEHVSVVTNGTNDTADKFQVSFDVIERLPSDRVQLLYATFKGARLVAKVHIDAHVLRDAPVTIDIAEAHVHLFDAVTGRRM